MRPSAPDMELSLLLDAIYQTYHYDFRRYAEASIKRRVQASLAPLGCTTISGLLEKVIHEPKVFPELLRYLTVEVSDLFRDPSYWRSMREKVVPYLSTYPSLKIWIAGCASGEEAYSFAILLAEEGLLSRTLIYATDINPSSLRTAEHGIYDIDRFARFSENYLAAGGKKSLSEYYTARYDSALFDRELKKSILFSDHSLATDSAFAEVELASCRNVLIYFEKELQDRAVGVLESALRRRGFLGLGHRETLRFSAHAAQFKEFVGADRIYQHL